MREEENSKAAASFDTPKLDKAWQAQNKLDDESVLLRDNVEFIVLPRLTLSLTMPVLILVDLVSIPIHVG